MQSTAFAVDLLGYGESDRPFAADFSISAQAWYLDHALTALRLPRAIIVGVDIGALAALRLAFERPERVDRLILISPPPLSGPPPEIRDLRQSAARHVLSLNRSLLGAMSLVSDFLRAAVGEPGRMPPPLVGRYFAPYLGREGLIHLQALARAIEDDDLDDLVLTEVCQPTLVLRGTRDSYCDRKAAEQLARDLPSGQHVEVQGVGRLIPEEAASDLAGLLRATGRSDAPNVPGPSGPAATA
jgi:pimeloyl-ACP methyl ester carboxylesterase